MTADMYLERGPGTARDPVAAGLGWPEPYATWYGGEFLPRQTPQPQQGWQCACGRGYAPWVASCGACDESAQGRENRLRIAASAPVRLGGPTPVRLDPSAPVCDDDYER